MINEKTKKYVRICIRCNDQFESKWKRAKICCFCRLPRHIEKKRIDIRTVYKILQNEHKTKKNSKRNP